MTPGSTEASPSTWPSASPICSAANPAEVLAGEDGEYRIDFAYRSIRLAIEVYGYAWHHSPRQLGRDTARQRALVAEGWTVLVFTWRQVSDDPAGVVSEIAAAHTRLSR